MDQASCCARSTRQALLLLCCLLASFLVSCSKAGNGSGITSNGMPAPTEQQVLRLPLIGTMDIATLDPALDHGYNETIVMNMLYSGLVRADKDLNVIPDQATWQLSTDHKTYTFTLRPHITFSDATPVTAQSYRDTWTRALRSTSTPPLLLSLFAPIKGADDVHNGKAQAVTGLKALDTSTLQVTLIKPAPYFLAALTNPLFFPLNQRLVARYDRSGWTKPMTELGLGTGQFIIKIWQPTTQVVFVPNPHYYGRKSALTQVIASFVNDPRVAFKLYGVGQSDLVWGITPEDQLAARSSAGFTRVPLLQTDALFVDTSKPPFDSPLVRQAFARAIDRQALIHQVFNDALVPAATLLPPAMPAYQAAQQQYAASQSRSLLRQAYPHTTGVVTFSYPAPQVSEQEATTLQQMWQRVLGVQVKLRAVEPHAYEQEMKSHVIQLGFTTLRVDFPDPYALFSAFISTSGRAGLLWHDASFERSIDLADAQSGAARLAIYHEAEMHALSEAVIIPLDHPTLAAVIPTWVHGALLNGNGLYFGDWSDVYILRH